MKLWDITHSRSGNKVNISHVYPLNFVMYAALGGGVTWILSVDIRGKGFNSHLLGHGRCGARQGQDLVLICLWNWMPHIHMKKRPIPAGYPFRLEEGQRWTPRGR